MMTSHSAEGAPFTCRGHVATIVGPAARLAGTPEADVIVTNGAAFVNAGGGNDLVCATGSDVSIHAGSGDDVVDSTGAPNVAVHAEMGAGADEFRGGPADDHVSGGDGGSDGELSGVTDSEPDVLDTGDGNDGVVSGSFADHNADVVTAGPGQDRVQWLSRSLGLGGSASGGDGWDTLEPYALVETWGLNNITGEGLANGVPFAAWTGMEGFLIDEVYAPQMLTFTGGPVGEHLRLPLVTAQVVMGAGDDKVELDANVATGSRLIGGPGTDAFRTTTADLNIWLDMRSGRYDTGRIRGEEAEATVAEFEKFSAYAHRSIWVRGTDGPDTLWPNSCDVSVAGRGGDDLIRPNPKVFCGDGEPQATINGGRGRDEMRGNWGDDTIRGGPGHDIADGLGGSDRCRAEEQHRCEL